MLQNFEVNTHIPLSVITHLIPLYEDRNYYYIFLGLKKKNNKTRKLRIEEVE